MFKPLDITIHSKTIKQQGKNISQTKKHKLQILGNMAITSANNTICLKSNGLNICHNKNKK